MKAGTAKVRSPTMRKAVSMKDQDVKSIQVEPALVAKAVLALIKYHNDKVARTEEEGHSLSLLGNDKPVQVQVGLELAPGQSSRKVVRIDIPNSIHSDEGSTEPDVCLVVKDDSKPWVQEMVEEYSDHMGCVKKVLTLESIRKKHSQFHQRRELMQKYDVFMADDRILPMLTSALGKDFVKAKKQPLPLTLTRKVALPFAIQRNLSATYMTFSQGTSVMIRAGTTGMPEKKLLENILAIAKFVPSKIPRGLSNIRNIAIKTPESASLPFYHRLPEELTEIAKSAGISPAFKASSGGDAEEKDKDDNNDSPKRKRDMAARSPLVRALKKQKQDGKDGKKKRKEDDTDSSAKAAKKKQNKAKTEEKSTTKKNEVLRSLKMEKKEKTKESGKQEPRSDEKAEFVASKRFKGSKEGYVFRRGTQGVGYYLDRRPVVDKMMLQALIRSSAQGVAKGGGRTTNKKKRGRR